MDRSPVHAWKDTWAMERNVQVYTNMCVCVCFMRQSLTFLLLLSSDVDECLQDDVCPPYSTCMNSLGTFSCTCNEGFSQSTNGTCEGRTSRLLSLSKRWRLPIHSSADIDECDMSMFSCIPEARCENTIGSYMCVCLPGYSGNGTVCEGKLWSRR